MWYLRAVEQPDGQWMCRHGNLVLGIRPDDASALALLAETALTLEGKTRFFVHYLHRPLEVIDAPSQE